MSRGAGQAVYEIAGFNSFSWYYARNRMNQKGKGSNIYLDHVTGRKSRFEFGIWSVFVSMLGTWDRVKSYSLQLSQSNIPVIRNPGAHQP